MKLVKHKTVIAALALAVWGAVTAAPEKNMLFDHDWSLLIINNESLRIDRFPDKKPFISMKEDGTFHAFMGCNQLDGKFTTTPDKGLKFGTEVTATKMACDKYYMDLEDEFVRTLSKVSSYDFQENKVLYFLDPEKKSRMIFTNVTVY